MIDVKITVRAYDIVNSDNEDLENCAVAKAIRRRFPSLHIMVGGTACMISLDHEDIQLPRFTIERLYLMSDGKIRLRNYSFTLEVPDELEEYLVED